MSATPEYDVGTGLNVPFAPTCPAPPGMITSRRTTPRFCCHTTRQTGTAPRELARWDNSNRVLFASRGATSQYSYIVFEHIKAGMYYMKPTPSIFSSSSFLFFLAEAKSATTAPATPALQSCAHKNVRDAASGARGPRKMLALRKSKEALGGGRKLVPRGRDAGPCLVCQSDGHP